MGFDTIIDGIATEYLGISVMNRPSIPSPEQRVDSIEIEGRHGSLTRLGAFKDIAFSVEYNVLEDFNIKPLLRSIRGFFFGKKTLRFSDDDVYYKIKSLQISETNNEIEEYGVFTVNFVCDPFQYGIQDTLEITSHTTLFNPGSIESEPIIKIFGTGTIALTINNKVVTVREVPDYVTINSELMNCYRDTVSYNDKMTGEFPLFVPGDNEISWTGNVQRIEIDAGWRYI